nr:MAG TPA: putative tail fiber protein [Caudoviricetes sp.]
MKQRTKKPLGRGFAPCCWYRKYSDGWIEQGGETKGSTGFTLTFPLAFSNTNYSFVCNTQGNSTGYGYKRSAWIKSRTATTVELGSDAGDPAVWYACGK